MSSKYIAVMHCPTIGFIIQKKKAAIMITGTDCNDTAQKMYKMAAKERVKVVFVYSIERAFSDCSKMIFALKDAGYDNISTLNTSAIEYAMWLANSKYSLKENDYIAFYTGYEGIGCTVHKKVKDGFEYIDDQTNGNGIPEKNFINFYIIRYPLTLLKTFEGNVHTEVKNNIENIKNFNWFALADNPKLLIQVCDIKLHVSYENEVQHFNIPYSEIPCTKTCEVVLQGTGDIEVSINYANIAFEPVLILFSGKKEKYQVTIEVSSTLKPDVRFDQILDYKAVEPRVFCIEWNADTKIFDGFHLDADVSKCSGDKAALISSTNIKSVIDELISYKPDLQLLGVMVNYLKTDEFPLDVHQEVINSLPTPTTKLIVGRIHAHYALNIKQSGIKVEKGSRLIISDWTNHSRQSYLLLEKKNHGFAVIEETMSRLSDNKACVLVIMNEESTELNRRDAAELFPNKPKIIFTSLCNIPSNMMHDYAWQYFNGFDFDDCIVESCGFSLWTLNHTLSFKFRRNGCHCPAFSCDNLLEVNVNSATGLRAYFSENPRMYIKYAGFKQPMLYLQATKTDDKTIMVKTNVDNFLVPSGTVSNLVPSSMPVSIKSEALQTVSVVVIIIPHAKSYAVHFWQEDRQDTFMASSINNAIAEILYFLPVIHIKKIINLTSDIHTIHHRIKHSTHLKVFGVEIIHSHSLHFGAMKLYQHDVKVEIGESIVLLFETKTATIQKSENGFNCVSIVYECLDNVDIKNIKFHYETYNVALTVKIDSKVLDKLHLRTHSKFMDLSATILTEQTRYEFTNSIFNDTDFHGYRIAEFDQIRYEIVCGDHSQGIHALGVKTLPFEVTEKFDITTSMLEVRAIVKNESCVIEKFNMTDDKARYISLTIKQPDLMNITASLVVLEEYDNIKAESPEIVDFVTPNESDVEIDEEKTLSNSATLPNALQSIEVIAPSVVLEAKLVHDEQTDVMVSTAFDESNRTGEVLPASSSETLQETVNTTLTTISTLSPKVIFTFVTNNRILISAGSDYTGDSEFEAYFRMESSKFGPIVTIGEEAKTAYKKHPKTVIYDIPGLLAADSNKTDLNPTWTFDTSRTADGTLLIHLGDDAFTSPVPLFASVVQSALLHVKQHVTEDVKVIGIRLPEASIISEENLNKVSDKLGIILTII